MREAKLSHMASGNNALDILNMACSCATMMLSTLTLNTVGAAGGSLAEPEFETANQGNGSNSLGRRS